MSPTISGWIRFCKVTLFFCLFISLTLPSQIYVFFAKLFFFLQGSCWSPSAVEFFLSDGSHVSGPRLHPFPGYPVQRTCPWSEPYRSHCDIPSVMCSVYGWPWVHGIHLQKTSWTQSIFVHSQDFSFVPCRYQHKFQTLISCDGPSGWLVQPCMAYFRLWKTEISHLCAWSIFLLARTIQLAH